MRLLSFRRYSTLVAILVLWGVAAMPFQPAVAGSPYEQWLYGPSTDEDYFPIGVWLQNPANAPAYKQAGINLYVGLWQGPTEEQLAVLERHGMRVIASQNAVALRHLDNPLIMGWLQRDEPDNAQPLPEGGYGPPIRPEVIIREYERMKAIDPNRPVFLNLGQGVANDEWVGRGPDAKLSDYPEYCKGADIVSFDVYPVAGLRRSDGEDYLWYVAKGLQRLREWCGEDKILWNILETTNISSPWKVTPHQLRAEVWMSLVHGSRGIIYFVHRFQPSFIEAGLLHDPEMLAAVTEINRQIHALAPVLNSPSLADRVAVTSSREDVPVAAMVKEHGGALYIFAVGMRNSETVARFDILGNPEAATVEVLYEGRTIDVVDGSFSDAFAPYDVHLYKVDINSRRR